MSQLKKLEYTVSFVTPAFLGGTDQSAQWRTPPFKALIRQWWRVVKATDVIRQNGGSARSDLVEKVRLAEATLFGSASDNAGDTSGKSLVQLRLDRWHEGTQKEWQDCGKVFHPEVGQTGQSVGADLYLGYGPLGYEKGKGTTLGTIRGTGAKRTAIMPEKETAILRLRFPANYQSELEQALQLAAWFGSVGSRSRNGWGSLYLSPMKESTAIPVLAGSHLINVIRPLERCLELDWPHALGSDDKGVLVWKTHPQSDWRNAVKVLAQVKVKSRTAISIGRNKDVANPVFDDRHLLAYPVTHHGVRGWVEMDNGNVKTDKHGYAIQSERLGNQLRHKVSKIGNQYVGVVLHVPCALPAELERKLANPPSVSTQLGIWQKVHAVLDNPSNGLSRLK